MTDNPVILITRPEPQASRFAAEIRLAVGEAAEVHVSPLQIPHFFGEEIDGAAFSAAVFTSETGVTGAARVWKGPKGLAFAVGDRTAEAASALGWLCESAEGAGPELAAQIARSGLPGPMVWPRGRHGGHSLMDAAKALGLRIEARPVYEQLAVDQPDIALPAGRRIIVPLFSPRSAALARKHLPPDRIETVAISQAAADAWGNPVSRVADAPNGPAMIAAIAAILHKATT